MIQNCNEQLLDDVVRIDLVLASSCHFAVPFQVSRVEMAVENLGQWTPQSTDHAVIGQALLSVAYNVQDGDDGEMDSAPSLKQSDKQVTSGIVVSHDLQIPVTAGFEATKIAVQSLQTRHFHVVLTTDEGTRYLLYSLPGSSLLLLDEQEVNQKATVKITLQSMSHVIRLT
jgi:hypothetical protein